MRCRNPPKTEVGWLVQELINVGGCADGSMINVLTFNGGSRGSSFKPNLVALNNSVRAQQKLAKSARTKAWRRNISTAADGESFEKCP